MPISLFSYPGAFASSFPILFPFMWYANQRYINQLCMLRFSMWVPTQGNELKYYQLKQRP